MKDAFMRFIFSLTEWYLTMLDENLLVTIAGIIGITVITILLVTSDKW